MTITTPANDVLFGILTADKTVNFSTPGGGTNAYAAIYGTNTVREGTWSNQVGISGVVSNYNTQRSQGDPGGTASAVGTSGVGICQVTACSFTWGGLMAAYDLSGQTSAPHVLTGLEVDNYAHGDGGGNRIGIQIVANTPDGAGTLNTVGHGLLFSGNGSPSTGQFANMIDGSTAKAQNAILLNGMTITGFAFISPGASIDGVGNSVFQSSQLPNC